MKNYLIKFFKSGMGVVLSALFGILLLRVITQEQGPEGLARFGLFRQFIQFCTVFLSWGNGFSIIKTFSKSSNKEFVLTNTYKYFIASCFVLSLIVALFAEQIAFGLFDDRTSQFLIFSSPLVFIGLGHYSFFRFVLAAKQHLFTASLLQGLPFLIMYLLFFFTKDMSHYFIGAYAISALLSIIFFFYWSKERIKLSQKFKRELEFEKSSIATLITGIVGFLSPLIVKAISVHYLGIKTTGVLEAEFSIMSYFTLAIIASLGTFYLSAVSANPLDIKFREKIFSTLTPITCLGISFLIFFDQWILEILFGESFLLLKPSLSVFGISEMFRSINWFFIFTMIGLGYSKQYLTYDIVGNVLYILASLLFVQQMPVKLSIEIGYFIFQFAFLLLNLYFCVRTRVINSKLALSLAIGSGSVVSLVILSKGL